MKTYKFRFPYSTWKIRFPAIFKLSEISFLYLTFEYEMFQCFVIWLISTFIIGHKVQSINIWTLPQRILPSYSLWGNDSHGVSPDGYSINISLIKLTHLTCIGWVPLHYCIIPADCALQVAYCSKITTRLGTTDVGGVEFKQSSH